MRYENKALRDLARGQECQAQIRDVCNHNPETTVSAHENGAGMGIKASDWRIAWCCSACHDFIDGRTHVNACSSEVRHRVWEIAHARTMNVMFEQGLLQVAGTRPAKPKPYKPPSKVLPRNWPPEAA